MNVQVLFANLLKKFENGEIEKLRRWHVQPQLQIINTRLRNKGIILPKNGHPKSSLKSSIKENTNTINLVTLLSNISKARRAGVSAWHLITGADPKPAFDTEMEEREGNSEIQRNSKKANQERKMKGTFNVLTKMLHNN